ncbi:efflux RND transporter periplasmic adaptor subunit [Micromonospora sp. DH14]|uniref:efflux RND transporter periplasmic adaptor subunit n=1 Tax=Micromonospora sp. DH14 TaxID=3040120 RepID=UPI002441CBDB|nr:efflux RND transporter periplasmic adaptor subunit [Micromonospora sp. DH14]MDG9675299.1 efflux RND transporter periplasmic adaptor subunit [Micromonospora sp. DH14]
MRTKTLIIIACVALALGGVVYAVHTNTGDDSPAAQPAAAKVATAEVVRTDLSDYWTESGTVGYRKQRTLRGVAPGVLTWLPRSGSTIARGDTLYRRGDRPVTLFYGSSPMFRDIDTVGMVGRDVKVLADNLRALGYQIGRQPAPGTRVTVQGGPAPAQSSQATNDEARPESPAATPGTGTYKTVVSSQDAVFTRSLKDAVQRWQAAKEIRPATGTVALGDIVVLSGAVRVGAASAQLGDDAAGNLMAISDQAKVVSVEIDASRANDIRSGQKVQITLPDSAETSGTVSSVSSNIQAGPSDGGDPGPEGPKVQVVITVDKAPAIQNISSASVEVRFTGTTERDVLAVPVGALLALSSGGYGVQIADGALTAVKVGLFADGMVQITGTGITAGTRVVTTS